MRPIPRETRCGTNKPLLRLIAFTILAVAPVGCGSGGMDNIVIRLPAYEPGSTQPPGSSAPSAKIRINPVQDMRTNVVGERIGEKMGLANISMGLIAMDPLPTEMIAQVFRSELRAKGHSIVDADEEFTIDAQVRQFEIKTPPTPAYWDIDGVIQVDAAVSRQGGTKHDARYSVKCTDRSYAWPSVEIINKVVSDCIKKIADGVRTDAALTSFLNTR